MGVADNKSYKNTYHFNDSYYGVDRDTLPSLNVDSEINSTIKKNPYKSNVEIEKDEVVFEPDMTALFKARGKKHYNGGMDVNLKPGSFIFSDDKTLAFDEKDHEMFELKKGGNFNKSGNTPADVLKRNVNAEHYNRMVTILGDDKKDPIAKQTSELMIKKYLEKLGQIAFVQEGKKNYPDGIPDFAKDTAPIYDSSLKDEVETQKQYAKYGGTMNPEMQDGGSYPTTSTMRQWLLSGFNKQQNNYECPPGDTPCEQAAKAKAQVGIRKPIHIIHKKRQQLGIPPTLGVRATGVPDAYEEQKAPEVGSIVPSSPTPMFGPTPNTVEGPVDKGKDIAWKFNPYQLESQAYNLAKYASAKRYMPTRSHLNSSYADASYVNPEQTIADVQAQTNSQIGALDSLNPIMRNAQASQFYGDMLDKVPQIRTQFDSQNAGISNQFSQYNNQIKNNESAVNMKNDQDYYQQTVDGQVNFDNMKNYLGDQFMNNRMGDVQDNLSLATNLMELGPNNPYDYDFRKMRYNRNGMNIMDVQRTDNSQEDILQMTKDLKNQGYSDKLIGEIIKSKIFQSAKVSKRGGSFNPYK